MSTAVRTHRQGVLKLSRERVGSVTPSISLAAIILCSILSPSHSAAAEQPHSTQQRSVLILNSYHPGFPWTDDLVRAITTDLGREFKNLDVLVEYMDVKRFEERRQALLFSDILPRKYANRQVDLLIATDDIALRFLHEHAARMFPRTPVVFCGVSDVDLMKRLDRSRFTGVHELFSTGKLMQMARRIRPAARRVYVVVDASEASLPFVDIFRRELGPGSGFEPVFLLARDMGLAGILDRLCEADAESIAVALSFTQDRNGEVVRFDDAMAAIAAASPVPVISPNISSLGQGILAGNANGGVHHGEFTAKVASRVLHGQRPETIAIEPEGGFGPVFDYKVMERWGIHENQLPREAVVINKPTGLWVTYRQWVLLAGGLIVLQMAIIGLLGWSITARRKAVQALRQSELRYREMVENAIDGIYSHDLEGRMTEVNGTMVKILGYEREELLAMSTVSLVAPEHQAKVRESTARKVAGLQSPPYEIVVVAKDGRRLWVEIRSRIMLRDGQPWGVDGVVRDISQRKNLENQLQQAQKMEALGRLAGGVAHDFNNILTVICGYANLLIGEVSNPKQRERLEQIRRAGNQATQLTRHLLSFSRSQAMEPTLVDLNLVVKDMVKMLRRFIGEDVTIQTRLEPQLGAVLADPTQLGQVVMNLALNARDAMPGGGVVTIETMNDGFRSDPTAPDGKVCPSRVVLTVTDTGVGMDVEVLRRAFDPFFTTKDAGRGTGLGLSVAYGIVRRYEGEIGVQSEPGKGASFRVSFPGLPGAPADVDEQGARFDTRGDETILVVEDRSDVREYAMNVLVGAGYRVLSAAHGLEALEIAGKAGTRLDLLLTDVIMPGMSGSELAARLVANSPSLRVILMSGYTAQTELDDKHGIPLAKPFSPEDLLRRVRSELDAVESSPDRPKPLMRQ